MDPNDIQVTNTFSMNFKPRKEYAAYSIRIEGNMWRIEKKVLYDED